MDTPSHLMVSSLYILFTFPLFGESSSQSSPVCPGLNFQQHVRRTSNTSLVVPSSLVVAVQFGQPPAESIAASFDFAFFPGGWAHSSPRSRCSVVHLQPSENSLQLPLRPANYGLWLFPFCLRASAAPSPTGGPAERPAPLIVSVSGLIEPNGNGCCQSSLFSSVYILIHKREVHYSLKTPLDVLTNTHMNPHSQWYW